MSAFEAAVVLAVIGGFLMFAGTGVRDCYETDGYILIGKCMQILGLLHIVPLLLRLWGLAVLM